tara:strand:- start:69 stop:344 length:276 start_codon:yes stop_codon:yes gene_type:complete
MIKKIGPNISHKSAVNAERDNIFRWYARGDANDEVAARLHISVAALHRHTRSWGIKKIKRQRTDQKPKETTPVSNKIKHLAINAKWVKASL